MRPSFSYSGGEVQVDESTVSHSVTDQSETASFADTEGNWYRLEAYWDSEGRLVEFKAFFNGEYVGRDNPRWSGMQRMEHLSTSSPGHWASSTADHQLIDAGTAGSGGGGGGGGSELLSCPDEDGVMSHSSCSQQLSNYGWESVGLVSTYVFFGAAALSSGPGAGFMVMGSLGALAYQTRNWYRSIKELDACVRA